MAYLRLAAARGWKQGRKNISTMLQELFTDATTLYASSDALWDLQLGVGTTLERPANVVGVTGVAMQGILTLAQVVTAGNQMTIGTTVYTFVADGTAAVAGDIDIGADLAATKLATVAALEGTDGINTENAEVDVVGGEFTVDQALLQAKLTGIFAIELTEDFTHIENIFDGIVMGTQRSGVDAVTAVGTVGSQYFDTTLGLPIYWVLTGWVNATGTDADA